MKCSPDPAADRAGEALCSTSPLLICTDGLVSYIRAIRETFAIRARGPGRTTTPVRGAIS